VSISNYCKIDWNMARILASHKWQWKIAIAHCHCPSIFFQKPMDDHTDISRRFEHDIQPDKVTVAWCCCLQDIHHWMSESLKWWLEETEIVSIKQQTPDKMCCIFHSKLKRYLNALYPIWETSFILKHIRKQKKTAWCLCIWLVGIRTKTLFDMFWENAIMQQQFTTETENILSIWPVISMNVCQQLLCIYSWILWRMLFGAKQMTTHFHCTPLFEAIQPAITNSSS